MRKVLNRLLNRIAPHEVDEIMRRIAAGSDCGIADIDGDCEFHCAGWRIIVCTAGDELEGVVSASAPDGRWQAFRPAIGIGADERTCLQKMWHAYS